MKSRRLMPTSPAGARTLAHHRAGTRTVPQSKSSNVVYGSLAAAAVERVNLSLLQAAPTTTEDQKIKDAILNLIARGKIIDGQLYPYSPSVAGAHNERALLDDAMIAVKNATAPREWPPADLRAVTERAISQSVTLAELHPDDEAAIRVVPMLREYTVFNVDQCENLPERVTAPSTVKPRNQDQRDPAIDEFLSCSGASIREGFGEACYRPSDDVISMPRLEAFKSAAHFYGTTFHELGHWTGHKSRLDRDLRHRFGEHAYAAEELVAELYPILDWPVEDRQPCILHRVQ
jgi:hypothetical protein